VIAEWYNTYSLQQGMVHCGLWPRCEEIEV